MRRIELGIKRLEWRDNRIKKLEDDIKLLMKNASIYIIHDIDKYAENHLEYLKLLREWRKLLDEIDYEDS